MKKDLLKKCLIIAVVLAVLALSLVRVLLPRRPAYEYQDSYKPGDTLFMGVYAGQPVEWLVAETDGDDCLLVSRYGLETRRYNEVWQPTSWAECTLRAWLNEDFLNSCFTEKERAAILLTPVDNGEENCNPAYTVGGGENTEDRVFLLSYAEANLIFGETGGACAPTDHAVKTGAHTSERYQADGRPAGWYWLRSPGFDTDYVAMISTDGTRTYDYVTRSSAMVRPALWVSPQKLK